MRYIAITALLLLLGGFLGRAPRWLIGNVWDWLVRATGLKPPGPLLSEKATAAMLGISPVTLRNKTLDGHHARVHEVWHFIRYDRDSVLAGMRRRGIAAPDA